MTDSAAAASSLVTALPPLIRSLELHESYSQIDQLQQQGLPTPPDLQGYHTHYSAATSTTLHTLVALLSSTSSATSSPSALLPKPLLLDLLLSLATHSVSVPSAFRRRYPTAVLSFVTPSWLTATNRALAIQAQRQLYGAKEDDEDEAVLAALYERHTAALVTRLRARMRGKGDEWKDDPSTVYVLFHLLCHLSASSSTAAQLVLSQLHELVPCILPLLHSHEQRHRVMGCLVLSHLLLLLPAYSFPAFVPLLVHTFAPLLSDRDSATQHIVLPTYVDLLLSACPALPLASAVDEAERTTFRLAVLSGHYLSELHYLSLSSSASTDVVCLYLEQLVRLLVWLNVDVLPSVQSLLQALFRLGTAWDTQVRRRAWVCVGVVMETGGERMGWHRGKVEERLALCAVECERQIELNERVSSGWEDDRAGGATSGESAVAREARERAEGWKATKQLVVDMRERLNKRWPQTKQLKMGQEAEVESGAAVSVVS